MLCEQQNFDNNLLQFRFATYTPQTPRVKARKMPSLRASSPISSRVLARLV